MQLLVILVAGEAAAWVVHTVDCWLGVAGAVLVTWALEVVDSTTVVEAVVDVAVVRVELLLDSSLQY